MRLVSRLLILGLLLLVPLSSAGQALELLPAIRVQANAGVAGVFEEDALPYGAHDIRKSGFLFQTLEIGIDGRYGDHFRIVGELKAILEGLDLVEAAIEVGGLPLDMSIRVGLMRSRVGHWNGRSSANRVFVDTPHAIGKIFGPHGHLQIGLDYGLTIPAPWELHLFVAMTGASGPGVRSWYGEEFPKVTGMRDFIYQFGWLNRWEAGDVNVGAALYGVLGPIDTGRTNGTDVWALAFDVDYRRWAVDVGVGFETEWYLRRRQLLGDALQDVAGYAQFLVTFNPNWGLAARYDFTQGVEGDILDPTDDEDRHRGSLQVEWRPNRFARLRASGFADMGGPYADKGSFGVLLHLETGWTTTELIGRK